MEYPARGRLSGGFPWYARMIGLPQEVFYATYARAIAQRAAAGQLLLQDLYGPRRLLARFPHWQGLLAHHRGYWPELVGRCGDALHGRFYGPDLLWMEGGGQGGYRFVVAEENGGNVQGPKASPLMSDAFDAEPGHGPSPCPGSPFEGWVAALRALAARLPGHDGELVLVDDASLGREPVLRGGRLLAPPYPTRPEVVETMAALAGELGVTWFSLVDEPGRLFVERGVLRVRRPYDPDRSSRVGMLVSIANVESIDPDHAPQVERNRRHGLDRYNDHGLLTGVPGLVEAWCSGRDGGFVWVNGPPSNLMKSKLTPTMVDDVIRHVLHEEPIAPTAEVTPLIGPDGGLDRDALERVERERNAYVFKGQLGADGTEIWFGDELEEEAWPAFRRTLEADPGYAIAQRAVDLATVEVGYDDGTRETRRFDVRDVCLVYGCGPDLGVWPSHQPVIRLGPVGSRRLNVSQGGARSLAFPAAVDRVRVLGPDEGALLRVDRLRRWASEGLGPTR